MTDEGGSPTRIIRRAVQVVEESLNDRVEDIEPSWVGEVPDTCSSGQFGRPVHVPLSASGTETMVAGLEEIACLP